MSCCTGRMRLTLTTNLGGPFKGHSATQTLSGTQNAEDATNRKSLRDAWNTPYVAGNVGGRAPRMGPFRLANNLGDYLGRTNNDNDGTGIPLSSTNVKFVSDSSDYIKFRKQSAMNKNYNNLKNGGDEHNGSYTAMTRVH